MVVLEIGTCISWDKSVYVLEEKDCLINIRSKVFENVVKNIINVVSG